MDRVFEWWDRLAYEHVKLHKSPLSWLHAIRSSQPAAGGGELPKDSSLRREVHNLVVVVRILRSAQIKSLIFVRIRS